jgi:hypothetical protein
MYVKKLSGCRLRYEGSYAPDFDDGRGVRWRVIGKRAFWKSFSNPHFIFEVKRQMDRLCRRRGGRWTWRIAMSQPGVVFVKWQQKAPQFKYWFFDVCEPLFSGNFQDARDEIARRIQESCRTS